MTDTEKYNQYFTNFDKAARWPVAVSINRNNSFPLDGNSLFRSYEDAKAYATKDSDYLTAHGLLNNSYVGQIISVYEPYKEVVIDPETGNPKKDAETQEVIEEIKYYTVKVYKTVPASINPDCLVQIDADTPLATTEQAGIVKLSNTLGTGEADYGIVPTGKAVIDAIDDALEHFDDYRLTAGTGEIALAESQDKTHMSLNVDSASGALNTFSITTTECQGQVAIELATTDRTVTVGSKDADGKVSDTDVVTFVDLTSALSEYKTDTLYSKDGGNGTLKILVSGEDLAADINKNTIMWNLPGSKYVMQGSEAAPQDNSIIRFCDVSGEGPITFTLDSENKKGVISVNDASTTAKGVVQLATSIDDKTANVVPTAAQVQDAIDDAVGKIATNEIIDGSSKLTINGTDKTLTATDVTTVNFGVASVKSQTIKLGTGEGETEINYAGITKDSRTLKFGTGENDSIATLGDIKSKQNRLIDGTDDEDKTKSLIWADGHLSVGTTFDTSSSAALMFDNKTTIALSAGSGEIGVSHANGIELSSDKITIDAGLLFDLRTGTGSGETEIDGSSIVMNYQGMDIASEAITITSPSITLSTAPAIKTVGTADNNVATIGQVNTAINELKGQIAGGVRFRCGATIAAGTSAGTVTMSGVNVTTIQVGDMFTVSSGSITIGESVYNTGDYFIATVASETLTDIPVANFTWIAAQDNDVVKLAVDNILTGDNTFSGDTEFTGDVRCSAGMSVYDHLTVSGETVFSNAPTINTLGTDDLHAATIGQINSAIEAVKQEIAGGTIDVATDRISNSGATLQIAEDKKLTTTGFDSISLVAGSRTVTVGATADGKVATTDVVTQGELTAAIGNIKSDRLTAISESGESTSIVYSVDTVSDIGYSSQQSTDILTAPRDQLIINTTNENTTKNAYRFGGIRGVQEDSVIRPKDIHCYAPISSEVDNGELKITVEQASTDKVGVVQLATSLDDKTENVVATAAQVKTAITSITTALKETRELNVDEATYGDVVNLLNAIARVLGAHPAEKA